VQSHLSGRTSIFTIWRAEIYISSKKNWTKIVNTKALTHVADLERLRREIEAFIMQAERAVSDLKPKAKLSKRSKSNAESQHDTH